MIDDTDPPDDSSLPPWSRLMRRLGTGWSALILFALALLLGLIAGAIWLHVRPPHPATIATDPTIAADPTHPPLPTPMAGGLSTLPPPSTPAANVPQVEVAPASSVSEPTDVASSAMSDASNPVASPAVSPAASPAEVSATAGDSEPQVIERHQPEYPSDALRAHEEGEVRLQVMLDAIGSVQEIHIVRSSGSHSLDRAAVDAVNTWRYRPARRAGEAVSSTIDVSVDFNFSDH